MDQLSGQIALSEVRVIGLSGQMHVAVLLNGDLAPIGPAILWNDSRALRECEELGATDARIGHFASIPPLPGFTAPKFAWLQRHEPATHRRIVHILLPKDYIGLCLYGELVTDTSGDAGTLWLDHATRVLAPRRC